MNTNLLTTPGTPDGSFSWNGGSGTSSGFIPSTISNTSGVLGLKGCYSTGFGPTSFSPSTSTGFGSTRFSPSTSTGFLAEFNASTSAANKMQVCIACKRLFCTCTFDKPNEATNTNTQSADKSVAPATTGFFGPSTDRTFTFGGLPTGSVPAEKPAATTEAKEDDAVESAVLLLIDNKLDELADRRKYLQNKLRSLHQERKDRVDTDRVMDRMPDSCKSQSLANRASDRVQDNVYRPSTGKSRVNRYEARPHREDSFIETKFHVRNNRGTVQPIRGINKPRYVRMGRNKTVFTDIIEKIRCDNDFPAFKDAGGDMLDAMKLQIAKWVRNTKMHKKVSEYNLPRTFRALVANPAIYIGNQANNAYAMGEPVDIAESLKWMPLIKTLALSPDDRQDAHEWMPIQTMNSALLGLMIVYLNVVDPRKTNLIIIRTYYSNWAMGPAVETLTTYNGFPNMINSMVTRAYINEYEKYRGAHTLMELGFSQ